MQIPNAFIGKSKQPTEEELTSALGTSAPVWKELVSWLAAEHNVTGQDWKCYSPKYGWSVQLKLKKRSCRESGAADETLEISTSPD